MLIDIFFVKQKDGKRNLGRFGGLENLKKKRAKTHVPNTLGKLKAENRTQAAEIARRYGLM